MYTVRDGLGFTYPLVSQHGATEAIGANNFLYLANAALNYIYSYNGYMRTWQHYSDQFILRSGETVHKLITTEPIALVDKFRVTKYPTVQGDLSPCVCPEQPEYVCACSCNDRCVGPCEPLDLIRILPHNNLCAGEYQIAGSEIKGMGGYGGRIIKAYPRCNVNNLRVSYFKGVKHVKSFDDILPLPDSFMHVFGMICAAMVTPIYGAMMQQQDISWWAIARKELDNFKAADNIAPRGIQFSKDYPFEQNPHTSNLLYGVQSYP